jgi:ferric-dicitrate binding protein FerR (iron transport regulator)
MTDSCERWAALSDRVAMDEEIAADEAAFARMHAASCASCRDEEAFWCDMAALIERPPMASGTAPKLRIQRDALPARRRPVLTSAAIAALAIAAAIAIWLRHGPTPSAPTASTSTTPAADVVLTLTSGGGVEVDGHPAVVGEHLRRGSSVHAHGGVACLVLELGVRACLAAGGIVRVSETGAARRLELVAGTVVAELETQPPGTSFGVTTRDGSAVAVGTAFSVEVPPNDAPVMTRVLHGTVVVRSTRGTEQRVRAHEMTSMTAAVPSPLPDAEETAARARSGSTRASFCRGSRATRRVLSS